jgi:hypothetical protein
MCRRRCIISGTTFQKENPDRNITFLMENDAIYKADSETIVRKFFHDCQGTFMSYRLDHGVNERLIMANDGLIFDMNKKREDFCLLRNIFGVG